jgi:uncharacterized protein (TIGR03437 family)
MNIFRGLFLSIPIAAISMFGGTAQQLPALPYGAVAQALQVDAAGNIYVAGSLQPGIPKSAADKTDAFVAKLSADGSKVLYFTELTGSGADTATALALGPNDSVYVTGTTNSSDFSVTPGALQTVYGVQNSQSSDAQAFAVKLDSNGATVYATYIGGTAVAAGVGIAVDGAGDAFVLGTGLPTGVAAIPGGDPANLGGFVVELNPIGSKMLMGFTGLGGQFLAIDGQGDVYLAGIEQVINVSPPFSPGAFQTSEANGICAGTSQIVFPCVYEYVAKADPSGTTLIYLTGLNGTYGATPAGIAADASGNAIVAGSTNSPHFPVSSNAFESIYTPVVPPQDTLAPFFSAPPVTGFIAKLNAAGSALIWSTFFGGSNADFITSMSLDADGNVILAGEAGSSDLPGLSDAPAGCRPSAIQALPFAARLTPDGTSASPAQLFYGAPAYPYQYAYGLPIPITEPIAVSGLPSGAVIALEKTGAIAAADLFAQTRLACLTDPADNVQLLSVAPGQDLTIFGTILAPSEAGFTNGVVDPSNGVDVTFNGIAAPILYASADQVNVQVPTQIAGQTTVQMKLTNKTAPVPLDETRTLAVVPQQPSVFLTAATLAGTMASCFIGAPPEAAALNANGSLNSLENPAAPGSTVTIFLNGVAPGTALTGDADNSINNPITFTPQPGSNGGALPVTFQIPQNASGTIALSMWAGGTPFTGTAIRETDFAVCVSPDN